MNPVNCEVTERDVKLSYTRGTVGITPQRGLFPDKAEAAAPPENAKQAAMTGRPLELNPGHAERKNSGDPWHGIDNSEPLSKVL